MPWRDLQSQPVACNLLSRSLKNQRVHHAYLLEGDESETKQVALAFAMALNCEKDDGDFCGSCLSCRDITAGKHPDMSVAHPESKSRQIVVEQIRDLEKVVFLRASRARVKVAIIYAADRMNENAQNALLKTLEEPPPKTVFLLLSEEFRQLRDTILSRSLRVLLRPTPEGVKSEYGQRVEKWLEAFASPISNAESSVIRAFGFSARILGLFQTMREERSEAALDLLKEIPFDHMETVQREKLREQALAQAHVEYVRERTRLLKDMLEWYHSHHFNPKVVDILEKLNQRFSRNINESLAMELAMLELIELENERRN